MASPFVSILAAGAQVRVHPLGFAFLFGFAAISFALYFLPFVIAASRRHPHTLLIFVLDFFLGWTLIAWLALLLWAIVGTADRA